MRKKFLLLVLAVGTISLSACSDKNDELSSKSTDKIVNTIEAGEEEPSEGTNCFETDYYNEGIDYKNNVIFNTDQKKFVKLANNSYEDLSQEYKETNIKYDDFDITLKWYYCKDGDRLLYKQDLDDVNDGTVNYGDYRIYIVTDIISGDTYLLLCKNSTHEGYSYQYPVKFDLETGEIEDVFKEATIDGKSIKDYGYLKNWELKDNEILVDCNEEFNEPEIQKWKRAIVNTNN